MSMSPVAVIGPPRCPVCTLIGREVRDARIAEHLSGHSKQELVEALAAPLRARPFQPESDDGDEWEQTQTRNGMAVHIRPPDTSGRVTRTGKDIGKVMRKDERARLHEMLARSALVMQIANVMGCTEQTVVYHRDRHCKCPVA